MAWRWFEAGCLPDHPLVHPLVAAGLSDHPQPPIGAEIIDVADVRAVLPIYHGLTSYVGISGVPTAPDAARATAPHPSPVSRAPPATPLLPYPFDFVHII